MTKRNRKLSLSRETVLRLDVALRDADLERIHGGDVSTDNRAACHTQLSAEPN